MDRGIVFAAFSDKHGEIIAQGINKLLPEEFRIRVSNLPEEKAFAPALIAAIVAQGEEYFGKSKLVVASYQELTLLFVPFHSLEFIAVLGLIPNIDPKHVAAKVESLFA